MPTLPLRHSVPLALAVVSILLTAGGIVDNRRQSHRRLEADAVRWTTAINHVAVGALVGAGAQESSTTVAETLARLAHEPGVTYAFMATPDGAVTGSTDPAMAGRPLAAVAAPELQSLVGRARVSNAPQTAFAPDRTWVQVATPFGPAAAGQGARSPHVLVTQVDLAAPVRASDAEMFWRSIAIGAMALAACLGVWFYLRRTFDAQLARMRADLRDEHARRSESEEKFARVFERAPALITISEIDTGRFIDVNDMAMRLTGYTRDEIIGNTSVALGWIAAEARARMIDILKRDGRVSGLEVTLRTKDGRALDGLVFAEVVSIEGQSRLLLICQNLTEYRRAQQARLDSERQFRQLLDKAPIATCVVRDGTVQYANQAMADMHQVESPADLVGQAINHLVAPELRPFALERARLRMSGVAVEERFESVHLRADGTPFPVRAVVTSVQLSDGHTAIGFFEDVSVQRDTERRLRDSEERFRQLFEGAADALFIHDAAGQLVDVNARACTNLGYTREQLLQRTVFDITPGVAPAMRTSAWTAIPEGQTLTVDGVMARADGTTFPTEVHIVPLDMGGQRLFTAAVRDVTHRQVAEQQLRDSEARFRQLFEEASDAVFIHDHDLNIVDVNEKACVAIGYSRGELLGRHISDFETTVGPDELRGMGAAVAAAGEMTVTGCHRRRDGSLMPIEVHSVAFIDGWRPLIFSSVRDISARLEAERHERESEARFRAIVENSHDGILFTDEHANILYRSPSYERINGWANDERVGHIGYETVHPDDLPLVQRVWQQMLGAPGGSGQAEYRIRHKDGSWRWVDTILRNLLHNPHVGVVVVMSRDITERKRAEAEREALQAQLAQSQKIEAVGRLAGGVAHDFNNMLSVILGFAEMALDSTPPGQPLREDLLEIQKAAERSGSLTRQLLAFARQQPVSPRVIDLNATVQDMLTMLRRLIGENLTLVWQPASTLSRVFIDPTQIDQILANLCVNARDAIAGVGTVRIETLDAVLDTDYCATHPGSRPGNYVCLAVHDTGCGMGPEVLAHIFEPFYTTKGVGKGTGLGLATVYGVVKQNAGYIDVHSQPGKGSRFAIYLPAQQAAAVRPVAPRSAEPVAAAKGTVLLVEDEAAVLMLTKRVLEHLGYRVLASTTPQDALRLASEEGGRIDLLMTDVIMPEMNGRDLAGRVQGEWPGIRCLFTSGYTADLIADHGVLDEGVQFLKKPWSKDELATKVQEALAQA